MTRKPRRTGRCRTQVLAAVGESYFVGGVAFHRAARRAADSSVARLRSRAATATQSGSSADPGTRWPVASRAMSRPPSHAASRPLPSRSRRVVLPVGECEVELVSPTLCPADDAWPGSNTVVGLGLSGSSDSMPLAARRALDSWLAKVQSVEDRTSQNGVSRSGCRTRTRRCARSSVTGLVEPLLRLLRADQSGDGLCCGCTAWLGLRRQRGGSRRRRLVAAPGEQQEQGKPSSPRANVSLVRSAQVHVVHFSANFVVADRLDSPLPSQDGVGSPYLPASHSRSSATLYRSS